ncbi:MAG: beta-glucosidase [Alphaproteobacteria bacterium RIFOXYD12_FULL_60_8]|nr:MAG: beta-glucosidase [Alphaproteobacteria bacterium RIFOXYD12_FULL_60_8]
MTVEPSELPWPRGFLWGASTSSYQIEGAVKEDGRGPSIWDTRCITKDKTAHGHTGDVACDHYHRYPEDIALMKKLGLDVYRFSVAWPRVLPRGRGAPNFAGLDFYDRVIDATLEAGMDPWLCLYHWDLPQGLMDLGGWTNRDCAYWFADYTALVTRRFGDRIKHWSTFNEFSVFTMFGYAIDWGAPGITDKSAHLKAIHHVNLAHGLGVDVVRAAVPGSSIGAIHNWTRIIPEKDTPEDKAAATLLDEHWNGAFPDPQILGFYPPQLARDIEPYVHAGDMNRICRPLDWFGLNHYGPIFAKQDPNLLWGYGWGSPPADAPKSDMGWPIYPDMFREALHTLSQRYKLPIYITENGCGGGDTVDEKGKVDDQHRVSYLRAHIASMNQAIQEGANVKGYFVWSLLDNFEWGSGYTTRFGIIHVDFETLKRTIKSSGKWYAELIKKSRKSKKK